MKKEIFSIRENVPIADGVYRMRLAGDTSGITAPGQFVNIKLDGLYLRRPISVCDMEDGELTLIYKTVGHGTEQMSRMGEGERLDILTGLGNGYNTDSAGERPLLVGGGVGVPPLYYLARRLIAEKRHPTAVLGFGRAADVILESELRGLGIPVYVATMDGSCGLRGTVIDAIRDSGVEYDYTYSCGPEPMLRALWEYSETDGQFSFERRMGCGFGGCMGCTCKTKYGAKRICKEGPVLVREEIIW